MFLVSGVIARGTIQGEQFKGKRYELGEFDHQALISSCVDPSIPPS